MITAVPWLSLVLVGVGGYLLTWTGLEILVDLTRGLGGYIQRRLRPG